MLLAVLVYMQEQQKCSHKAWHIHIEIVSNGCSGTSFQDTHREKAPLNKTPALLESMNMNIWVVGISNQLSITGSYSILKQNFQKNKLDAGKTVFFVIGQFYNSHSICLNSFWEGYVFAWICYPFNCKAFNCKTVHYFFTEKVFIFQKICFKVYWKSSKFPLIVSAWVLIPPSEPQPSNFFCPPKHWKF